MTQTARIALRDGDLLEGLRGFFRSVLALENIGALLVPQRLPMKNMVMPTLVTDPDRLDGLDPLAPAFPMNSAKIVSRLTRRPAGEKIAVVMRPCEIRAFVELVKLHQGSRDDIVVIGLDCLGAYRNRDYFHFVNTEGEPATRRFYRQALLGENERQTTVGLSSACTVCELPIPDGADLVVGLYGVDIQNEVWLEARTPAGEALLGPLGLPPGEEPQQRRGVIEKLTAARTAARNTLFVQTAAAVDSLEKLTTYLATCVNCYNCRVACPVCYCRECVFVTDVFDHDPAQYLGWASRKGVIKMPTDTVFYHLTRLAHMSTACVGCGQCSNACPNDIPVMALFRTVAHRTQQSFGYQAGRRTDEKPPLSEFREKEFEEVVGLG
jgi:formate dehydrogenase subunit beta